MLMLGLGLLKSGLKSLRQEGAKTFLKKSIAYAHMSMLDFLDVLLQRRRQFARPRRMLLRFYSSGGDDLSVAREFVERFISLGGLHPNSSILDVGCGIGRMAVPLTEYISSEGIYEGFDINKEAINWCQRNITRKFPNFQFHVADVYNKLYNADGKQVASEYRFPYPNGIFDLVISTSVFTHMLPADFQNYVSEIARVLRNDGRCFATFLLLNTESIKRIAADPEKTSLQHDMGIYRTLNPDVPESVVALDEQFVQMIFAKNGLSLVEPVSYGQWRVTSQFLSGLGYQDVVVTKKATTVL